MNIGLLLIATGKYDTFVQPLIDSIEKHFFKEKKVIVYLFTDTEDTFQANRVAIKYIWTKHEPFPYATLNRYSYFCKQEDTFIGDGIDYLFYCDVDMLFVSDVSEEILPDSISDNGIVAVRHPGFINGGWGSPNVDIKSMAYVEPEKRGNYYAGGFQGGLFVFYMLLCKQLHEAIFNDNNNGVMAEWHDESHFNKYLTYIKNPKILSHQYCMPDDNITGEPKILALSKDYKALRF